MWPWKCQIFNGRKICFDVWSGRGLKSPPLINNIKGPNRSTNNNIWTFQYVPLFEGLNLAKKHDLDKKWTTLFYEANVPFNVVQHPMFHKSCESNLQISNLLQTPIILWIVHRFLKQSKVDVFK